MQEREGIGGREVLLALSVLAVAAAFRVGLADAPPLYDELYHLLAAKSWVDDGSFAILDGSYERARLYTILVGLAYSLFGETTIEIGRLPAIIPGALLAPAIFLWTRHTFGTASGWIAAAFAVLWPSGILLSQTSRFYALHGLMFFLGAVAVWAAAEPGRSMSRRIVLLAVAALCFALATHLTISTLIGVIAIAIWAALFVVGPLVWASRYRWSALLATAALALLFLMLALTYRGEEIEHFWTLYLYTPWNTDIFAYHRALREYYPTFWPLYPAAALVALYAHPRAAAFCVTIFATCLVFHSFSGHANLRYLYYVTPFFFAAWAVAIHCIVPPVFRWVRSAAVDMAASVGSAALRGTASILATGATAAVLLFAVAANPAAQRAVVMALGGAAAPSPPRPAWVGAREALQPWLDRGAFVVATTDLHVIEYVGDFDLAFSMNRFPEWGDAEFVDDPRTGRPLISRPSSLELVVRCEPIGAILATADWWSNGPGFATFAALTRTGAALSAWRKGDMSVLAWEAPPSADRSDCRVFEKLAPERRKRRVG